MNEYRVDSADYKSAMAMGVLFNEYPELGTAVTRLMYERIGDLDKDGWIQWKNMWKLSYKELSDTIRDIKKSKSDDWPASNDFQAYVENHGYRQFTLANLSKIANTLINCRIHARDVRRAIVK